MTPLVDGGARAKGCVIKGCAAQPERGKLICDLHGQLLRDAAARKQGVPPAVFSDQPSTVDRGEPA
jgi:hypothetical protein